MTKIYVSNIVKNIYNATIATEMNIDRIKKNMEIIYDRATIFGIGILLNEKPEGISLFTTFKQFIVRFDNNKIGKPIAMIFYDCKNDINIARDIYNGFTNWDDITKDMFIEKFTEMKNDYNKDDLAVMELL